MNRRTVLQSAGVVGVVGLAGCVDGIEEHFMGGVQSPVPIEVLNDGSQPYNVSLEGRARDGDRETYDENFAIIPDERVWAPQIEGSDQQFRVTRVGDDDDIDDLVETAEISESSQLILITIHDDEIELEMITDEDKAEERQEDGDADEELDD